jgi:hypothetical protein
VALIIVKVLWFLPIGDYMFVKHGDGKILSVVETEEMTDEQKKSAKKLSQQTIKQADIETDTSEAKRSGR